MASGRILLRSEMSSLVILMHVPVPGLVLMNRFLRTHAIAHFHRLAPHRLLVVLCPSCAAAFSYLVLLSLSTSVLPPLSMNRIPRTQICWLGAMEEVLRSDFRFVYACCVSHLALMFPSLLILSGIYVQSSRAHVARGSVTQDLTAVSL
jgi:hypothetical protein